MNGGHEQPQRLTSTGAYRLQPRVNTAALLGMARVNESYVAYGRYIYSMLPEELLDAARDTTGARALVLAVLFDDHEEIANDQARALADPADQGLLMETLHQAPLVRALGPGYGLSLVEQALPALRRMSNNQYDQFKDCLAVMASADHWFDLFEYLVHRIVAASLDPIFLRNAPPPAPAEAFLPQLASQVQTVISALAWMGKGEEGPAAEAVALAATKLRMSPEALPLLPTGSCTLGAVDGALDALYGLVSNHKQVFMRGCAACVAGEGDASLREAELLRAIAIAVGYPLPPLPARDPKPNASW